MTEQVKTLMENLDITEEEALQIIEDDKAIDKGAKLFELSDEQKVSVKKACRADRKPNSTPTKREKKEDIDKLHLMKVIQTAISHDSDVTDFEFINQERECVFHYKDKKYKIVLSCPRS